MKGKRTIGVLAGGDSPERDISLVSGSHVHRALIENGHDARLISIDSLDDLVPKLGGIDVVLNCLHGGSGEDGTVQLLLDVMGIPYTGSGAQACFRAMEKPRSRAIFATQGIPIPEGLSYESGDLEPFLEKALDTLGLPMVIKPGNAGSTVAVHFLDDPDQLHATADSILAAFPSLVVEEYIEGREITVGVLRQDDADAALPVIEIRVPGRLFDYEAKYTDGVAKFLTPAPLDAETAERLQEVSLRAHEVLGCTGYSRVDLRLNNKRVIEALIGAGAFDGLGPRAALTQGVEVTLREAQLRQRERETGQGSLFGGDVESHVGPSEPPLPEVPEWGEQEKLAREKEMVGFFVSGHPLDAHRDLVELYARRTNASNLAEWRDRKVEIACVVTEVSRRISRKDGSEWARILFEDYHGTATALAFRDAWSRNRDTLEQGKPVLLRGSVSGRERDEGDPPLFLDTATPLEQVYESGRIAICIELSSSSEIDAERLAKALKIARAHPGQAAIHVVVENGSDEPSRLRSRALLVTPLPSVLAELRGVLGEARVRLVEV